MKDLRRACLGAAIAALVVAAASAATAAEGDAVAPAFSNEQLEQVVAPVALYPDSLLAQVFMASTYPLEVVEAARFAKENPKLKDEALDKALQDKSWDASVKSLVTFPQVLDMMNEKLDWTQKLGDAVLAQQPDLMDAVQRLRAKAKEAGNLESNEQQKVIVEQAPAPPPTQVVVQQAPPTIIKIEQASPQVVYVPTYNPTVVYGPWPYPAYPPYYYYPPGYVATTSLVSFGIGMAVGASLWGDCHWGHGGYGNSNINVNVNHYNNFNNNVNRNWNSNNNNFQNGNWQHDASHRKGVEYRDKASQQRYGGGQRAGASSREAYRGRAEQGQKDLARPGGAEQAKRDLAKGGGAGGAQAGTRDVGKGGAGAAQKGGAGGAQAGTRDLGKGGAGAAQKGGGQAKAASGGRTPSSFEGMGHGSQVRQDSSRGNASRQSASSWGSGGGSRGGGGGGGGRGGGGGGGGGRR